MTLGKEWRCKKQLGLMTRATLNKNQLWEPKIIVAFGVSHRDLKCMRITAHKSGKIKLN